MTLATKNSGVVGAIVVVGVPVGVETRCEGVAEALLTRSISRRGSRTAKTNKPKLNSFWNTIRLICSTYFSRKTSFTMIQRLVRRLTKQRNLTKI